jgi:CBS-domain-containing membrane protein
MERFADELRQLLVSQLSWVRPTAARTSDRSRHKVSSRLTARELMTRRVATVRPDDSIQHAATLLEEFDCSALPVVDGSRKLIGMITDRDITMKLVAKGLSIPHAQVGDCMTQGGFSYFVDDPIEGCLKALSWHQLRRIPILDQDQRVVGIISQSDLAGYACGYL